MKNTKNTIAEMNAMGMTDWFTEEEYKAMSREHDWVKMDTLRHNQVLEVNRRERVVEMLTPEQMAEFVNSLAGEDCWGGEWRYRWNAENMGFENVEYEYYYRVK